MGRRTGQRGGATFLTAVILLVVSSMIGIFAANINRNQDKLVSNQARGKQAYSAAEAGLEFGIGYLMQNNSTIIASPVSGFINYSNVSTTNISLADGSKYSVVYTNPTASNYNLITVTSTGTSADSTATRVVMQQIYSHSVIGYYNNGSLVSLGQVSLSGNSIVTNTVSGNTIDSASTVGFSGNGKTVIASGTSSNSSSTKSDVQQNVNALSSMTQSNFFASYFGTTSSSSVQNQVANNYTNSSNTNYSATLNGMTGTSIWITQTSGSTATISGNTTIGSAASPVLLIVNGNLSISGNVTINGFVFIMGSSTVDSLSGNITINGGLATTGNLNMSGNSNLTYSSTILTSLSSQSTLRYYGKVAGTWKDF